MSTTSATLLTNAYELADEVISRDQSHFTPVSPPPDSFMINRPNHVHESYAHGQGVTDILRQWKADPTLLAAGLLHSFVCKGALSTEQVIDRCGERVRFLCQEYQNILHQQPTGQPRGNLLTFKRIKFYIAAYRDPAIAFLGIANLWDHFLTVQQSMPVLQRSFAFEAAQVLIPVLKMLGMWDLQEEVADWVMQHGIYRSDYNDLVTRLAQTQQSRREVFEFVRETLQPALPQARLSRKIRTPTQIHNPQFPEKTHPEVLQKLTVDVLVDTEDQCYAALRWINHYWKPVEGSLSDSIGISQLNGYRCLQTGVIVPMGNGYIRVNFHIRTQEMEEVNQWGLAALELRDRQQTDLPHAWWSRREETYEKIISDPIGSLPETLYVFSPHGQLFQFHRGCSVVDYAYNVHSEIAHECKRFKVNGEVVGPTTVLRHLDLVELERDPQFSGPTRVWLNAAHTSRARNKIKQFINRKGQSSQRGQNVFDRHLQTLKDYYRIDIPQYRIQQILNQTTRKFKFDTPQDLLAEIAAGRMSSDSILHPLFAEEIIRQVQLPSDIHLSSRQLSLAQCCKPRPGDKIVGRPRFRADKIIRLKIHKADCGRIADHDHNVALNWRLRPQLNTVIRLEITALHEPNLLKDILNIIYQGSPHIFVHKMDFVDRNGIARIDFTLEAKDQEIIDQTAHTIEQLHSHMIKEVRQMQLLFLEREELTRPMTPKIFNPYRRLPVQDRDMFFGRTEDLAKIYDLLRGGTGVIFIRGQKRVGKTSLLLHLKEHYLHRLSALPIFIDFQILSQLNSSTSFYDIANTIYTQIQYKEQLSELVEPPLKELFDTSPPAAFVEYLQSIQTHLGSSTLILLIDEFSRTIDAYRQGRLDEELFEQWRGVLHATIPKVNYVLVVQQQTHDALLEEHTQQRSLGPVWHLLELGETLVLEPLSEKDARQLIEQPTHNYFEYSPEALRHVWRLTGGSPFLIQAFCYNLVRHMARSNRQRVEWDDVQAVQADFMNPNESLFAHLLDMISGVDQAVCQHLTYFLDETDQPVPLAELNRALPNIPTPQLIAAVQELTERHVLVQPKPNAYQFASLLFARWLTQYTLLKQFEPSSR